LVVQAAQESSEDENGLVHCDANSEKYECFTTTYNMSHYKRILPYGPYVLDGGTTLEKCMQRCYHFKMDYTGIYEQGPTIECYCGDTLEKGSLPVKTSECETKKCTTTTLDKTCDHSYFKVFATKCSGDVIPNFFGCMNSKARSYP
jgi:hypothetical protein